MKPIMHVKVYCKTCFQDSKDGEAKHATAYIYQINDNAYFVQFYFRKCGHRKTSILTKQQIEALEVKDG